MKAIVPLDVAALRVSDADAGSVTSHFAGRTAVFDELPYLPGVAKPSTGDQIWRSLENPAREALTPGIHLHWELPEYFKRGVQDGATGQIRFPAVPNRWLITRTLRIWNSTAKAYGPPQATGWVVESDYLTEQPPEKDGHGITRLPVAVPLPAQGSARPYLFMGRVLDAATWDPASTPPTSYLPGYPGVSPPMHLTSIGFTGAAFSSYYPDCRSVFGFWDCFEDSTAVFDAIWGSNPIRFAASYAVTGWLADGSDDPMPGLAAAVRSSYDDYVASCVAEKVAVSRTPAQVFSSLAEQRLGWVFTDDAISYTLNRDSTLDQLNAPDGTLCAGTLVDVVWNGPGPFLAPPPRTDGWTDQVQIAAGNTTAEAVAALVASQLPAPAGGDDPVILDAYETLLEALQLGILRNLESDGNALVALGRARHDKGFSSVDGGHVWTIQSTAKPGQPSSPATTLPLTLAEQLAELNQAQAAYDQAREALITLRQQLFMDWLIYVAGYVQNDPFANALGGFLDASGSSELTTVTTAGAGAGLVVLQTDARTGRTTITTTSGPQTLAGRLVAAHQMVADALAAVKQPSGHRAWTLDAVPAPAYWMPTDPVLVIEGNRIEPARRNGPANTIAVRTDAQLLGRLAISGSGGSWTVDADQITGLATVSASVPAAIAAVLGEAALLDPQRSAQLAGLAGASAPAGLATDLAAAVGGESPLDPPVFPGLFAATRAATPRVANPTETVGSGAAQVSVTFTNARQLAYAPDPVGWTGQASLPEFSADRHDPYLPVWMLWSGSLDPLAQRGNAAGSYVPGAVVDQFSVDAASLDFGYPVPAEFTTGTEVSYSGEVVLSKTPMNALVAQIDGYLAEFAQDPADPELLTARADLAGQRVMSQALDTFNLAQTLRRTIPQLPVMDLTTQPDFPTSDIADAARPANGNNGGENWYDTGFNALQPIATGPQALGNFGPLRAGFAELETLSLVDVFGQRLGLDTAVHTPSGALTVKPAGPLKPAAGDKVNAAKLYLPPRVLTPTRLEAHWLSASHNDAVAGISDDFLESNDHPATSPVCGWLLPNHLDLSLMCYDADGRPVGSFVRIGEELRYQTRAGNTANPHSDLATDIGPRPTGGPVQTRPVNSHLAELMWFVDGQSAAFLTDLLATIDASGQFIAPSRATQDIAVSILIGRPLAIVRMALGLGSAGGTLPVSQAKPALQRVVDGGWTAYGDRQAHTSAGLGAVEFAIAVGDHSDLDDGLVGYLPEGAAPNRYSVLYSTSAPAHGDPVLVRPGPDTVTFTVNASQAIFTALVDPRAPIHLSSGLLPTATLQIPPDQYAQAMQQLGVTFTTRPVLSDGLGIRLPLPVEPGYGWAWVAPGAAPLPLPPTTQPETPVYGHGPQTLAEGWLLLQPDPAAAGAGQAGAGQAGAGQAGERSAS